MPTDFLANAKPVKQPQSTDDFLANATPVSVAAPTPKSTPKEGFFHSLGSSLGITPESSQAGLDELKAHPIATSLKNLVGGPALPAIEGAYQGAKRIGGELVDAGKDALSGNSAGAIRHGIDAIPFIGPGEDKAAQQNANGDYLGEAGTLLGTAAQAAPALLGGIDSVAPGRGLLGQIPRTSRAVAKFESLNNDLSDLPVPLKSTLQPLQRATELGVRGGTLPKPVSDLLTRSQAVIDPTYPEIRDYQSNLSDLSREQKGSLNGKMLGQIGGINKGLYQDIFDATSGVGRGEDFASAMKEFRQARQLKKVATNTAKYGGAAAVGAAGAGGIHKFLKVLGE